MTLDEALAIFAQPKPRGRGRAAAPPLRELGADPVTGQPIVVREGRFGAYVTDGETNATLRKGDAVETVTVERAAELLAEKRAKGPAPKKRAAPAQGPRSQGRGREPTALVGRVAACSWRSRAARGPASPPRWPRWSSCCAPAGSRWCRRTSRATRPSARRCAGSCSATRAPGCPPRPRPCCTPPTGPSTSSRSSGRRWRAGRSWSPTGTSTPRSRTRGPGGSWTRRRSRALSAFATGGLVPDLTVLLDLDPAEGLGRAGRPGPAGGRAAGVPPPGARALPRAGRGGPGPLPRRRRVGAGRRRARAGRRGRPARRACRARSRREHDRGRARRVGRPGRPDQGRRPAARCARPPPARSSTAPGRGPA